MTILNGQRDGEFAKKISGDNEEGYKSLYRSVPRAGCVAIASQSQ